MNNRIELSQDQLNQVNGGATDDNPEMLWQYVSGWVRVIGIESRKSGSFDDLLYEDIKACCERRDPRLLLTLLDIFRANLREPVNEVILNCCGLIREFTEKIIDISKK